MTGLFNIKHQINIMKRLSVILFVLATVAALVSCSENGVKYTVNGFNAPEEGSTVYLTDRTTMVHIDSAVVSGGTFRIKGKADKDAFLAVEVNGHEGGFVFFNDGEPVQVDVAGDALTGSALNTKLAECIAANNEAYDEYSTLIKEFLALPEAEQAAKMEEFMPLYHAAVDKYSDFFFGLIEDNMDSLIPVAFMGSVRSLGGEDKFNEFLEAFTSNPFRHHEDKAFRKELIENLIKYCFDHMSLLTATLLLKKKFTIEEVINNYYANVDAFGYDVF